MLKNADSHYFFRKPIVDPNFSYYHPAIKRYSIAHILPNNLLLELDRPTDTCPSSSDCPWICWSVFRHILRSLMAIIWIKHRAVNLTNGKYRQPWPPAAWRCFQNFCFRLGMSLSSGVGNESFSKGTVSDFGSSKLVVLLLFGSHTFPYRFSFWDNRFGNYIFLLFDLQFTGDSYLNRNHSWRTLQKAVSVT